MSRLLFDLVDKMLRSEGIAPFCTFSDFSELLLRLHPRQPARPILNLTQEWKIVGDQGIASQTAAGRRTLIRRHWMCKRMREGDEGSDPLSLFDVLDLLAQFFDLDFDIDRGLTNAHAEFVQTGCFGEDGGDLPVHFLKDEIHPLARLVL